MFFKNSFAGRSVGTVPTRESNFGAICSPMEVSMSQQGRKNGFSDFSRHFGAPPGLPFSPKFGYFWPKTWVIMWWFTPFLDWADIWTVEPSKPILVKLVGNRDDRRESGRDPPSRFGRNSGQGWSFSKIPSRAGQWELCPPGRVILEQFAARWRFL